MAIKREDVLKYLEGSNMIEISELINDINRIRKLKGSDIKKPTFNEIKSLFLSCELLMLNLQPKNLFHLY